MLPALTVALTLLQLSFLPQPLLHDRPPLLQNFQPRLPYRLCPIQRLEDLIRPPHLLVLRRHRPLAVRSSKLRRQLLLLDLVEQVVERHVLLARGDVM